MIAGDIGTPFGVRIIVDPALPLEPSDGERARRIVRHGLADVLRWLGEDVGPEPDAVTQAFVISDPPAPSRTAALVSRGFWEGLYRESAEWQGWGRSHGATLDQLLDLKREYLAQNPPRVGLIVGGLA